MRACLSQISGIIENRLHKLLVYRGKIIDCNLIEEYDGEHNKQIKNTKQNV